MARGPITHDARGATAGVGRAVAIGNFDGVHRGHARLVGDAILAAKRGGLEACVLTFSPHPAKVLAPDRAPPLLLTLERRIELLFELGVDHVIVQPFDAALASLPPRAFVEHLLRDALCARVVCVGYDFNFGAKRAGNATTLGELGSELGFTASVTPAVRVRGQVCASTTIRSRLGGGEIEEAAALLGRPPELEGQIVRGAGRGRTIGIPTANLALSTEVRPAQGVYAGWAVLADGTRYRAAINVGTNPTFTGTGSPVTVEAHLLDFDADLYGAPLRLALTKRVRAEKRFDSKDALVAQIHADIAFARTAEPAPLPPID